MTASGQLREWLDRLAVLGGVVSAAEALVATPDAILFRHTSGFRVGGERLTAGSGARFDAASLTKPWVATLALALDGGTDEIHGGAGGRAPRQKLSLRERLKDGGPTLDSLLRHCSGMPAWTPLAVRLGKRLGQREELVRFLRDQIDGAAPIGEGAASTASDSNESAEGSSLDESLSPFASPATVYSDLDFLLWGLLVEERVGKSWTELLDELVCAPLGMAALGAVAVEPGLAVECRLDNGKEVELAAAQGIALARTRSYLNGVVQDGNARALRAVGIAPAHAGLFVTPDEALALGREWLRPARVLSRAQVESALAGEGEYALGWARWSEEGSSGPALSRSSFGHTGFTGGSLWIDPERSRIHVLLAHRLSSAIDFNPFRREFHRLAAEL